MHIDQAVDIGKQFEMVDLCPVKEILIPLIV